MTTRVWTSFAALALAASLSGCNPYPLPGPLHYGKCGPNAHTEAYPRAKDERHAYGCKSDDAGYLEGPAQGDQRRN
jgi:hypothetical protein